MVSHLLSTKLNIPQLRPALIPRPRLIEKFNAGLSGRLTLVSAPAGFGKTTVVTDWLDQLSSQSHIWRRDHCAWLSLNQHDNQAVRFLQYLIAAVQVVYPDLGGKLLETLDNSPRPNIQTITQDLLNEITENRQPLLLILDDYHEIYNQDVHQILQTSIDYLPSNSHFVITTRQDPPLSLPRWRARSWLSDITTADLRFDHTESADFLRHTMRLDLKPEAVSMLEERTEGWVAGLQLAALSLADTDFSPESIEKFGGRDRYVAEYLLTEVLDQQPIEFQQFLLPTSILDRLNADLCTAMLHPEAPPDKVTLIQKYQNLITSLERSNLFIIPLDRERYWYRYHHLFTQLLRQRLERMWKPDEIRRLYCQAAYWFADREFLEEAISHALQGKDYAFTARLIAELEMDNLWNQTWGLQLRQWGAALPSKILQEYPKASIHIAIAHMTRNEVKKATQYIELVRDDPRVNAEILLTDSIFTRNKGDLHQALFLATKAAELFKSHNQSTYIAAQTQVVVCLMNLGDLSNAEELATVLQHELQTSKEQYLNIYIQAIHILGIIKEQRAKLVEAERIYLDGIEAIEGSGITMPLIGLLQVRLSAIYYQWNDIDKAMEYCNSGMAWGDRSGISDIITQGALVQVDLAIRRKDETEIKAILGRISKLMDWPEFKNLNSMIQAAQALYDLRLGNLPPAVRWADSSGLGLQDQPIMKFRVEYRSLAWVRYQEIRQLGTKDQISNVLDLVDKWINLSMELEYGESAIYYWLLKALLLDLNDQSKDAITALNKALDLALPGGYIRNFIDFGTPMRDLIQKSLAYDQHMTYKRRLLLAFSDEQIALPTSVLSSHEIPVTLTPREFEILQLIAGGLSNKAIQENLMLSKNTVRTHIKNLYSKLGVHSRTQAIRHARENGLI
jgi:LuxR family maltose regulon positive regulatory protein